MLNQISAFAYIIAAATIVGLVFLKKLGPQYIRLLVLILGITLLIETGAVWFVRTFHVKNHWIYNLFTPVQFLLYAWLFYRASDGKMQKVVIKYTAWTLIGFFLFNILVWQGYTLFNSYTFMLSGLFITFFTLSWLVALYNGPHVRQFNQQPMFWVCIGILFYFPPNIIVTGFIYELYLYSRDLSYRLYQINKVLNILMYGFFLIALMVAILKWKRDAIKPISTG